LNGKIKIGLNGIARFVSVLRCGTANEGRRTVGGLPLHSSPYVTQFVLIFTALP